MGLQHTPKYHQADAGTAALQQAWKECNEEVQQAWQSGVGFQQLPSVSLQEEVIAKRRGLQQVHGKCLF